MSDLHGVRSKKASKRRARGAHAAAQDDVLVIPASQAELVRTMRLEPRKETQPDDPDVVTLSRNGRAAQLQLSEDRLAVTGSKGFRSVRASHGAAWGTWYCEASVEHLGPTGHVRLGWCTRKAELHAPVGYDKFGYCYRDVQGCSVHEGLRQPYGRPYGEGDTVGMVLHLPPGGRVMDMLERGVVRYKGSFYHADEPEPEPQPLQGSLVAFTCNGELQGVAYSPIREGMYYSAASLYTLPTQAEGARVRFNFGPHFKYPLPQVPGIPVPLPVCDMAVAPTLRAATVESVEATEGPAMATADNLQDGQLKQQADGNTSSPQAMETS